MNEPCEVCNNNNVPAIGYDKGYCPDCGSFYYYDESVTLVLDSGQLRAVQVFSVVRAWLRRLLGYPVAPDWHYEMVDKPNEIAYQKALANAEKENA